MLARQNSNLISRFNWNALFIGAVFSLGLSPLIRWFISGLGFVRSISPGGMIFNPRGWTLLFLLSAAAVGVGAFIASYVNRPLSGREGVFQGLMVWALVSTARWILTMFNVTLAARNIALQSRGPAVFWIGFFANVLAATFAVYGGWLGAGPLTAPHFRRGPHRASGSVV